MLSFDRLFRGREDCHGLLVSINFNEVSEDGKFTKKGSFVNFKPPYQDHLTGKSNKIGIIPFVLNDRCYFGAVDYDNYNCNHKELIATLRKKDIPGVVTRSTNGGAHIWFFFEEPINSTQLKAKLEAVRTAIGIGPGEVFPKQKMLKKGGKGNFIFIPYYPKKIDSKKKMWVEGCDTYGFDDDGKPLKTVKQFEKYANGYICTRLKDMNVKEVVEEELPTPDVANADPNISFDGAMAEAPPCVQAHYTNAESMGSGSGRNTALMSYGIFYRKAKGKVTLEDLKAFNNKFKDKLDNEDVKKILKQVNSGYFYKCDDPPNEKVCNKELCYFQKYGIGRKQEDQPYFDNYIWIYNWTAIVKLKPEPVLLRPEEAKKNMLVEKGKMKLGNAMVEPYQLYVNSIARKTAVDVQEWHPGKETLYTRKGHGGEVKVYNAFRPTLLEEVEGSIAPWDDYMDKRFENEKCNKYFQDFLAHKIQRPEVRNMSNILLISNWGGTGKSLIDETMHELLGPHNVAGIDLTDMQSGWGDTIINKLWISVEEIHDTGAHRKRIASIIKRLTTIKRLFGNMKYGKFQQADIYASLMFMSNEKTAITIKKEDRRPFIYKMDNDKEELVAENNAEGDLLAEWLKEDQGYEKLLHNYRRRDISEFNPTAWPPQTKAKAMMVKKTFFWKYEEVLSAWENKSWPFTEQSKVYAPQHIAKLLKCDKDDIEELFKDAFGCQFLCRVTGVEFVIHDRHSSIGAVSQVDSSKQNVSLWTDDEELIEKKKQDLLKPKDAMGFYLHPCMNQQRKVFAQDDRVGVNLMEHLEKLQGDGMKSWDEYIGKYPGTQILDGKNGRPEEKSSI